MRRPARALRFGAASAAAAYKAVQRQWEHASGIFTGPVFIGGESFRKNSSVTKTSPTKEGTHAMTHFARHFGAALVCAFLWLPVSTAQAAVCNLIFEAIPSKDAGPIIGGGVNHILATKNFASWSEFTQRQAIVVAAFLEKNFDDKAKFGTLTYGLGGFEGKSSPNASITVEFKEKLEGAALGKAISVITAAVGYMLIQDGTVANCDKPVAKKGGSLPLYSVSPGKGFQTEDPSSFVRTVYSAIVVANDKLDIGYTFTGKRMLMLDFGGLTGQLDKANFHLKDVFTVAVSFTYKQVGDQPSIYIANNWVEDPEGLSLLKYNSVDLRTELGPAQKAYIVALRDFALGN